MAPEGCSRRSGRPLVGRDDEVARLIAAVAEPDGRGAVVAGESGVGKSHLLEEATAALVNEGWTALRARGDPARTSPFGSLGSLLPPTDGEPQPWAVVLRRGLDHLVAQADSEQPLLVADDLHAFDAASATLVQHAVLAGRVRLLGSFRTGDDVPDAVTALWKDDVVDRLDLDPLPRPDADALVEELMGGPVDAETRGRLWHWTEGNPLLLTEVVVHGRGRGNWHLAAGLWHLEVPPTQPHRSVLSPTLASILEERMAGAPPGIVDVVDALALAGHLPLSALEHLVGRRTLAQAERSRLTRTRSGTGGRILTLEHPLYGELRRCQLSEQRVAEVQSRVLDVFERFDAIAPSDVPLLAGWYEETGRTGHRAVELLTRGAELALGVSDPRTAAELARGARRRRPDDRNGLALINALARLGERDELQATAEEVARDASSDRTRAEAVVAHALCLFQFANRPDAAEQLLSDTAAALTETCWRNVLVKQAALFRLQRGDLTGAEILVRPLLITRGGELDADVAAVLSPIRLLRGQIADGLTLARRAALSIGHDDVAAADSIHLDRRVFRQIGMWVEAGQLGQAEEVVNRAIAALDEQPDPFTRAFIAFQAGRIARLRGRPDTAARWFREAAALFEGTGRDGYVAWALAGLVEMQAQLGEAPGAAETAEECRTRRNHPIGLAAGEVARSLAWELVVTQRLDEAADAFMAAGRRSVLTGEILFAAHAFHDLVRIGHADRGADRLDGLAEGSDGLLLGAFARHARATVAGDVAELEAVAGAFADLGCELYAAETWGQVAARGEEAGMQRRSAAAHRAMVDCRQRCERARTPLLATSTTAVSLSPRERQIARLAASGMPRRDIAAHLVISPRTVDSHLQRIYRKLGVEDRQGLAAALPPRPPDSDAPRALTG